MDDKVSISAPSRLGAVLQLRVTRTVSQIGQIGSLGDDVALVRALQEGHPGAPAELFDRYGVHVQKVLTNVLGFDSELPDLLHEVFAEALENIAKIRDGSRLKAWITQIAVFVARGCIRSRVRRRWLGLAPTNETVDIEAPEVSEEVRDAIRHTYEVVNTMPADLRIAFVLRFIQGMELQEVADACDVSLATIKRRLVRAEAKFRVLASRRPTLAPWLAGEHL